LTPCNASTSAVTDEPDNRILECAVAGNVDMFVTGDRHLLDLKEFEGIEIVKLAVFMERGSL
jgi:predicted nucleic acid-binding protein